MLRKTAFVFAVLALMLAMSSTAFAQKTTVARVVVVKTDNVPAYLQALESNKEILKKLGITAQIRIWQAIFAGPQAGSIVVAIEYPNMGRLSGRRCKNTCR